MPISIKGLNHLGLVVEDMDKARKWFIETLGLRVIEDRGELLFLAAGKDVIALKTPAMAVNKPEHGQEKGGSYDGGQHLDHYGFFASNESEVDDFAQLAKENGATILKGPYSRSDGRSVYVKDPCNLVCEFFYFAPNHSN